MNIIDLLRNTFSFSYKTNQILLQFMIIDKYDYPIKLYLIIIIIIRHLYQRLSVALQRFNAVYVSDTFAGEAEDDL
jgi:hypothetical protein